MKRLLMVILTIGGMNCAVDSSPEASPTSDDETTDNATTSTMSDAPKVTPSFVATCLDGVCEFRTACLAAGGHPGAPCTAFGAVCCE
jgi:hypothetical protein